MKAQVSLLVVMALFSLNQAHAYSAQGHEGIAEFAHEHVNAQTREILDQYFLKDNAFINKLNAKSAASEGKVPVDNLAKIAVWADDLKFALRKQESCPLFNDSKAADFNKNFKNNGLWHFLDLPLGASSFVENSNFNLGNVNVVDAINGAINVLEGRPSGYANAANQGVEFTKKQALHLLVHLVGDIHQPLHVGSGYYQLPSASGGASITIDMNHILVGDPAVVDQDGKMLPVDRGGNLVHLEDEDKIENEGVLSAPTGKPKLPAKELHAQWDDDLVQKYAGTEDKDSHVLAQVLGQRVDDLDAYLNKDVNGVVRDYHQWAVDWANDSVLAAAQVYQGITYHTVFVDKEGITGIIASEDDTYDEDHADLAAEQLKKQGRI